MTKFTKAYILYRATKDGFEAYAFHNRCDGKAKTITTIRNNLNYVFGGYLFVCLDERWASEFKYRNFIRYY